MRPLGLNPDTPPSGERMLALVSAIESSPRPLLFQGNRGIQGVALASALADLLEGRPPAVALRHFDPRYGEFGGPEHSPLATVIYEYQGWLSHNDQPHTADRFRAWVGAHYGRVAAKPVVGVEKVER
jgi:hypothetical protein